MAADSTTLSKPLGELDPKRLRMLTDLLLDVSEEEDCIEQQASEELIFHVLPCDGNESCIEDTRPRPCQLPPLREQFQAVTIIMRTVY